MARIILATAILASACGGAAAQPEPHPHQQAIHGAARGVGVLSTMTPSPVPTATPIPTQVPDPWELLTYANVTHYGESYHGRTMGCGGTYWSDEPAIIAVGPAWYSALPCGTPLRITGPAGALEATRTDSCPGCHAALFDLSEAGQALVCGSVGNNCSVTIERRR